MTFYFLFLFALLFACIVKAEDVKTWATNTNFDNPKNWKDGRLPCSKDKIIFPSSFPVVTFMSSDIAFSEMVLPADGELIFPENFDLKLTGSDPAREDWCEGKDAHFLLRKDYWFDPDNWNITSPKAQPASPSRANSAVPHSHRVPCVTDRVLFPEGASFASNFASNEAARVASLQINNVEYDNQEIRELLEGDVGRLLFPGNPSIVVTGAGCVDSSGCVCGNDASQVLSKICAYQKECPAVQCSDPVTPTGFCCPICAAYLVSEPNSNFRLNAIIELHNTHMTKVKFQQVESFVDKMHQNLIQSVFIDSGPVKGGASEVAQIIHDSLTHDIETVGLYKIKSVKIYQSINWNADVISNLPHVANGRLSSGGIAAVIVITLILLSLSVVGMYIYKRRHIPGFSFARFDLSSGRMEMELGTTPHSELDPESSSSSPPPKNVGSSPSKGFDNPVYGTETAEREDIVPVNDEKSRDSVENPMFMVFEDILSEGNKPE